MQKQTGKGYQSFFITVISLAVLGGVPSLTAAQEDSSDRQTTTLDTITVTAQKTEENVQDVPIGINVFSDIDLEDKEINDIGDVAYYVPNFYFYDFGMASSPSIRGISAEAGTMSSVVGLYVDGVPKTDSMGFNTILENIERIEVLRGPQGTLYGKNAEAGVINVITKKPDNTFAGKLGAVIGEDSKQEAILHLQTPLIEDKLYMGISGSYYAKAGFMKDHQTGKTVDDEQNYFGRFHLRTTPTDRLDISFIASRYKIGNDEIKQNTPIYGDMRVYYGDLPGSTESTDDSFAFAMSYDFDSFTLESISSLKKMDQYVIMDYDRAPLKIMHSENSFDHKTISQEVKLSGQISNLKWLVGGLVNRFENQTEFRFFSDNPTMNGTGVFNNITEENFGLFAHLNYAFTDRVNLIGGIRYDKDEISLNENTFGLQGEKSFSNISPKIALEYKLNPSVMTYATIAKGYKSGGYYALPTGMYPNTYDNETLWSYEAGLKSELQDKKLLLNASIFYIDMKDKQIMTTPDPMTTYISNAASVTSYGFELDGSYKITSNFNIFASFGYNEATFDEFEDITGNHKDNSMPNAPKYSYSLGGIFRGFGGFYASTDIRGYAKTYSDSANTLCNKAYTLVNAKFGYEWDKFDFYAYAENLSDKQHDVMLEANNIRLSPPREIGVKLTYRF